MKKVLVIVPNLRLGGQEKIAVRTADLLKEDYEVTLVIFDDAEAAYSFEGNLITLNIPAKPGKLFKIWNVIRRSLQLRRIKRREKIDFSYSFGESANIVNILSKSKDKTILSIHGYADLKNRPLDRFLYKRGNLVVCCSEMIHRKFERFFPKLHNAVTIYNPYDVKEMEKLGREDVFDFSPSGRTVITHGRLHEVKNYPRLIRSFALLHKRLTDTHLVFIGEGEQKERLLELASALKIEDFVHFVGFKKNPFSYIKKADIYVLSSYNEGFPNALIEGMAFLPAISVDCKSGPDEILDGGICEKTRGYREAKFGLLVEEEAFSSTDRKRTETDQSLADAMLYLFENETKYKEYKKLAKERASHFSNEKYKEKVIKIFSEIT